MRGTLAERLMARVRVNPATGCWEWTGSLRQGYGQIWTSLDTDGHRRLLGAHRASYELARGEIPERLDLDHLCRNTICVNPDHLEPVTRKVNVLRGDSPPAKNAKKSHCDTCGRELVDSPWRGQPRHCPSCRPQRRGKSVLTCEICGSAFEAVQRTAMCCSQPCRSLKSRRRRGLVKVA